MFGMLSTIVTLFVGAAVIYAAILSVNAVVNWFRNRSSLVQSDKNNLAFTICEKLDSGDFNVYQGIFNTSSNELVDGQKMQVDQLDEQMQAMHSDQEMVVYR